MTTHLPQAALGAAASSAVRFAIDLARNAARFAKTHWIAVAVALCILLLLAAVAIPKVIVGMPEDYFAAGGVKAVRGETIASRIGRNLFGAFLFAVGSLLFIPPGAGTIFMVAGMVLMDFPGKRRLELKAIRWRGVLRSLNFIRRRGNVPPFRL